MVCLTLLWLTTILAINVIVFILDFMGIIHPITISIHLFSGIVLLSLLTPYVNYC